jgi:hypothetical protein
MFDCTQFQNFLWRKKDKQWQIYLEFIVLFHQIFDQQTFCLAQLNNKKSQRLRSGLCGSNLPGSGTPIYPPGTL